MDLCTKILYGCAYAHPLSNDLPDPLPPGIDPRQLRARQLADNFCKQLINKPIMVNHYLDGTVTDPVTGDQIILKTPVSGYTKLGHVTSTWINPSTSALHFTGTITYDRNSSLGVHLDDDISFQACSLQYDRAMPPDIPVAAPIELSICHTPLWADCYCWKDGNHDAYMRKTGYMEYVQSMAEQEAPAVPADAPPRDAAGRFTAPAPTVPSATDLQSAFDQTPELVRDVYDKTSSRNLELESQNDQLAKKAAEVEKQLAEKENLLKVFQQKVVEDRLESFEIFKTYILQNPTNASRPADPNVDMRVAAANMDPASNAMWTNIELLVAQYKAEQAATQRSKRAASPPPRQEFNRSGYAPPQKTHRTEDLVARASQFTNARVSIKPKTAPPTTQTQYIHPTVKASNTRTRADVIRDAFNGRPAVTTAWHDEYGTRASHLAVMDRSAAKDEFFMPIGMSQSVNIAMPDA